MELTIVTLATNQNQTVPLPSTFVDDGMQRRKFGAGAHQRVQIRACSGAMGLLPGATALDFREHLVDRDVVSE
jgi:hypothetical protein